MLILISWLPGQPDALVVERFPRLFATQAECRMYGDDAVAKVAMYPDELHGRKTRYECLEAPDPAEFDIAWEDRKANAGKPAAGDDDRPTPPVAREKAPPHRPATPRR